MANDIAFFHGRNHTVKNMQIRAADGAGSDLDDRILRVLDLRIRDGLAAHVAFAVPA
jgi:hypothetical protein